jgi:hypothetical protein
MIGIVDLQRAEADLAAGELACPGCGGELRRRGAVTLRTGQCQEFTPRHLAPSAESLSA